MGEAAAIRFPGPRLAETQNGTGRTMKGEDIQIEDGNFTRIHNTILEALYGLPDLSGVEMRLLMFLFRQTYGWQRKETNLSYSQIASALNSERHYIMRVSDGLIVRKIVGCHDNGPGRAKTWWFNKCVEEWTSGIREDTSLGGIQTDTTSGIQTDTTSGIQTDTLYKEKKEKEKKETSSSDEGAAPLPKKPKVSPKKPKPKPGTHPNTKPILDAYQAVMEEFEPGAIANYAQEGAGAKRLAQAGHEPETVADCYRWLKTDQFWACKHVSLQVVGKQIGAYLGVKERKETIAESPGGNRPRQTAGSDAVDRVFARLQEQGVVFE